MPLKREDIVKLVLKDHARAFAYILLKAQDELNLLGMQLVPVVKDRKIGAKKTVAVSSYILASTLSPESKHLLAQVKPNDPKQCLAAVILSLIYSHGRIMPEGI